MCPTDRTMGYSTNMDYLSFSINCRISSKFRRVWPELWVNDSPETWNKIRSGEDPGGYRNCKQRNVRLMAIHTTGGYTLNWIQIRFWLPSTRQSSIFALPDLRPSVGVADCWLRLAGWWRTPLRGSCCWRGMVIAAEESRAWFACWVATGGASEEKPRNGCEVFGTLFGSWGRIRALW